MTDFLAGVSDEEPCSREALVPAPPAVAAVRRPRACRLRGRFGRGRHGGLDERRVLMAHARSKRAERNASFVKKVLAQQCAKYLNSVRRRGRGIVASASRTKYSHELGVKIQWRDRSQSRGVSFDEMLQISYAAPLRSHDCGLAHGIDKKWVRTIRAVVASAYLGQQLKMLATLLDAAKRVAPTLVMSRVKFDETGQRLALVLPGPDTTPEQQRSTYQVFVLQIHIRICWADNPPVGFDLALPPARLLSTGASAIWNTLHGHPLLKGVMATKHSLEKSAQISAEIYELDGALANQKYIAHALRYAEESHAAPAHRHRVGHFFFFMGCRCHVNRIIEVTMLRAVGLDLPSKLYSLTLLLKSSGYFARVVQAVEVVVKNTWSSGRGRRLERRSTTKRSCDMSRRITNGSSSASARRQTLTIGWMICLRRRSLNQTAITWTATWSHIAASSFS